jgi:hypothetical protein
MANGVLLLNNETKVICNEGVDLVVKRHKLPFALSPKFTCQSSCFPLPISSTAGNREAGLLSAVGSENEHDLLLELLSIAQICRTGFKSRPLRDHLRDPNYYPSAMVAFRKQFNLTLAKARLCRTFADGLTLNDYCENGQSRLVPLAASSTACSKDLHAPTVRSAELIFLFSSLMPKFIHHLMDALFNYFLYS